MVRILQAGWETGDIAQIGSISNGATALSNAVVATATPSPRNGVYSMKVAAASTGSANTVYSGILMTHASKTELYYAFGVIRHNSAESTATTPNSTVFVAFDTAGNANAVVSVEADGTVRAYFVTAGGGVPTGAQHTLVAASATNIVLDTWTLVEVHLVAATGSTGTFEVKINGVTVITATSQRTCQTNANFGAVRLQMARLATAGSTASYMAFDDFRVNDTTGSVNTSWLGDEAIKIMVPTSAGDSTQFSRGGSDSGANWSQADDVPPNGTTDYVYDSVSGHLDLYNTTDFTVQAISAVNVIAQVMNSDGAGGTLDIVTKTGAGESDGAAVSLTGTPTYQNRLLDTDPADSGAWTQTKLTALQLGFKVP